MSELNTSSPAASANNLAAEPRVGIFWDYENCATPAGVPGYIVAEYIRNAAHRFGPVSIFKAYLELSTVDITPKMINLRSELQSSGVSLTDCPRASNRKDVVDKMLLVDMLAFAMDNPAPAVIMLISGDRDFVYAVSVLRHRKYDVVLVVPPQGAHITLRSQATVVLDWRFDIFREDNVNGSIADSASTYSMPRTEIWNRSSFNDTGKSSPASHHRRLSQAKPATPDTEPFSIDAAAASLFNSTPSEPPSTPPPRNISLNEAYRTPISGGLPPEVIDAGETLPPPPPMSPTFYISPRVKRATPEVPATNYSGVGTPSGSSSGSATDPTRMFNNLIEVLEEWRLMGNDKPLRSKLGTELVRKNPLLYQRVGVKNFTEYVNLAEKAGVVRTGFADTPGREWIALTESYKGKIFPVM
ncbi:hypothetical protein FS837_003499 [Tulasnella sp. UAMH 9824]|nr:hypothetical protein FS837_003499 [Tulasnella sp. UAMH 9824]